MSDLVEHTCQVVTTDNAIIYNPSSYLGGTENFHPVVCGEPAYDFVDYGDDKVWLCLKHWISSNSRTNPARMHPPDFEGR